MLPRTGLFPFLASNPGANVCARFTSIERIATIAALAVIFATVPAPAIAAASAASPGSYTGSGSCGSTQCHGSQRPLTATRVRQDEYVTWVLMDHHAKAWQGLTEERSARIARNLHLPTKPEDAPRCLDCHSLNVSTNQRGRTFDLADGVSCEACHGPASNWLGSHTIVLEGTSLKSKHAESVKLGMTDTKDLVVRVNLCLSCHLGDERRSVDHELIAAGHPDLVFEIGAFTMTMPTHWNEPDDKGTNAGLRAWGSGQTLALSAALAQLDRRVSGVARGQEIRNPQAAPEAARWPEFAEYECFACHHDLQKNSPRQTAGYSRPAESPSGRPVWNPARTGVFAVMLRQAAPGQAAAIAKDLDTISDQMSAGALPGTPSASAVSDAAKRAAAALAALAPKLADPNGPLSTAEAGRSILKGIVAASDDLARGGCRSAEQTAMAIDAIQRSIAHDGKAGPARKAIDRLLESVKEPSRYDPRAFASDVKALGKALS